VTVETLRDAQGSLLPAAEAAVKRYDKLSKLTQATKYWIFQQRAPGDGISTEYERTPLDRRGNPYDGSARR